MTIDTNSLETIDLDTSDDLLRQTDTATKSQLFEEGETMVGELDDRAIIWRFAQGKKRLVVNDNLRIDYAHSSLQLSTPTGELIAIHKVAERLHYILVKKDSNYSQQIQDIISECQFIPIDTATAERGFTRYQKYEIPAGYDLSYEQAEVLWQTWQQDRQQQNDQLHLDISILARSKWYRVQQMICSDDRLDLQTRLGLISFSLRDRVAWVSKLVVMPTIESAKLAIQHNQNSPNDSTDSEILDKIISKLAIEAAPDQDLHTHSNLIMSNPPKSSFSHPDSALAYNRSSAITPVDQNLHLLSEQLRTKAIDVLEEYLDHGETIVRTETICDAQGNTLSEKTITTTRGCPRWAIEAIMTWQ
jgi:hypothetical protein